jgi:hypothetical protein
MPFLQDNLAILAPRVDVGGTNRGKHADHMVARVAERLPINVVTQGLLLLGAPHHALHLAPAER